MRRMLRKLNTRLLTFVLAALMLLSFAPKALAAEYEGACGDNLTWTFEGGILTITGTGDMTDYDQNNMPPWYDFREKITSLSLPDGLTSIGELAFYDCTMLNSVTIPSSVTEVGQLAFCQCCSISIIKFNEGLVSIGRSAFELCESLTDLRLPTTLKEICYNAFYRCTSLTYATVPASVTSMDDSVFAYCESLIRADVEAPLETLPPWTFYGCVNLTSVYLSEKTTQIGRFAFHGCELLGVVYYGGNAGDSAKLKAQINEDISWFFNLGEITDESGDNSGASYNTEVTEEGDVLVNKTEVVQSSGATITTTTTTVPGSNEPPKMDITATVVTPEGWEQVSDDIENAVENSGGNKVTVTIYTNDSTDVPQEVISSLSGKDVVMTVQSTTGSKYVIDFSGLSETETDETLDLSYSVVLFDGTHYEVLNGATVFQLIFNNSSTINAEVMIQLPVENARKTATLYQVKKDTLETLQSVAVDDKGVAHFYLASVDKDITYLIGINVPGASTEDVIVPEALHNDYGITDTSEIEYVVTGRTSSWNMTIGQITWILAGGMVACALVIGIVMFYLNKRKLRKGYVPDIEEE